MIIHLVAEEELHRVIIAGRKDLDDILLIETETDRERERA